MEHSISKCFQYQQAIVASRKFHETTQHPAMGVSFQKRGIESAMSRHKSLPEGAGGPQGVRRVFGTGIAFWTQYLLLRTEFLVQELHFNTN
jgi:hypothetical protein